MEISGTIGNLLTVRFGTLSDFAQCLLSCLPAMPKAGKPAGRKAVIRSNKISQAASVFLSENTSVIIKITLQNIDYKVIVN